MLKYSPKHYVCTLLFMLWKSLCGQLDVTSTSATSEGGERRVVFCCHSLPLGMQVMDVLQFRSIVYLASD